MQGAGIVQAKGYRQRGVDRGVQAWCRHRGAGGRVQSVCRHSAGKGVQTEKQGCREKGCCRGVLKKVHQGCIQADRGQQGWVNSGADIRLQKGCRQSPYLGF